MPSPGYGGGGPGYPQMQQPGGYPQVPPQGAPGGYPAQPGMQKYSTFHYFIVIMNDKISDVSFHGNNIIHKCWILF